MADSSNDKKERIDVWKLYAEAFNATFPGEPKEPPVLQVMALQEFARRLLDERTPSASGTIKDQRDALRWLQERVFDGEADNGRHARSCIQEVLNNMEGGVTENAFIKGPLRPSGSGVESRYVGESKS